MNENTNNSFTKKHPLILNAIIISITFIALCYVSMFLIDLFTNHGNTKEVPNVKNLPLREAISKLEDAGFKWEISDSTYNDSYQPGVVKEQDPKANSSVKALRIIYLSVNATSPRLVSLPALNEISIRQGQALLDGLGFKNITVSYAASPFKELILGVTANGKQVEAGTKIPLNSRIVLTIGDGNEAVTNNDSIDESFDIEDASDSKSVDFQ